MAIGDRIKRAMERKRDSSEEIEHPYRAYQIELKPITDGFRARVWSVDEDGIFMDHNIVYDIHDIAIEDVSVLLNEHTTITPTKTLLSFDENRDSGEYPLVVILDGRYMVLKE